MRIRSVASALLLLLVSTAVSARVISYSPYSDHVSYPATQHRMNRRFAIFEVTTTINNQPFVFSYPTGQLVLYDSKNIDEPRVIFPQDASLPEFSSAAVREENG